ncbi:hypothetical protein Tco_1369567 [Tanacetum coccineum]
MFQASHLSLCFYNHPYTSKTQFEPLITLHVSTANKTHWDCQGVRNLCHSMPRWPSRKEEAWGELEFTVLVEEQVRKLNSMLESLGLVPQSSNAKFVCSKEGDGDVMFIEISRVDDENLRNVAP